MDAGTRSFGIVELMATVKERVAEILQTLTPQEQQLLSKVLKLEQEELYLSKPQLRDDLMRAVKDTIK